MATVTPASLKTSRVIRPGEAEPADEGWRQMTPAERMTAAWELTRLCLAWNRGPDDVPRLQRSVVRIQRPSR